MSKENLLQKGRSFSFHSHSQQDRKVKPLHVRKRKFITHKPRYTFTNNKLSPSKIKKGNWFSRKIKRAFAKGDQPPTPHNTTQFIVDAVNYSTDPYIYEYDNNRFEHDFQHHAMAGSMMQLMQEKLDSGDMEPANPQARSPRKNVEKIEEEEDFLIGCEIPKLRLIRSADDGQNTDSDEGHNMNYDQLLLSSENKNGKNLQDVIKELVNVIKRKDNQINTLLLNNTQKKELLHGN